MYMMYNTQYMKKCSTDIYYCIRILQLCVFIVQSNICIFSVCMYTQYMKNVAQIFTIVYVFYSYVYLSYRAIYVYLMYVCIYIYC